MHPRHFYREVPPGGGTSNAANFKKWGLMKFNFVEKLTLLNSLYFSPQISFKILAKQFKAKQNCYKMLASLSLLSSNRLHNVFHEDNGEAMLND